MHLNKPSTLRFMITGFNVLSCLKPVEGTNICYTIAYCYPAATYAGFDEGSLYRHNVKSKTSVNRYNSCEQESQQTYFTLFDFFLSIIVIHQLCFIFMFVIFQIQLPPFYNAPKLSIEP